MAKPQGFPQNLKPFGGRKLKWRQDEKKKKFHSSAQSFSHFSLCSFLKKKEREKKRAIDRERESKRKTEWESERGCKSTREGKRGGASDASDASAPASKSTFCSAPHWCLPSYLDVELATELFICHLFCLPSHPLKKLGPGDKREYLIPCHGSAAVWKCRFVSPHVSFVSLKSVSFFCFFFGPAQVGCLGCSALTSGVWVSAQVQRQSTHMKGCLDAYALASVPSAWLLTNGGRSSVFAITLLYLILVPPTQTAWI